MKKSKILLALILSTIVNTNVYAVDTIDLTSLSAGDEASHNHVWTQQYDSTYHWSQCEVCKADINRVSHSLSTKYTHGSTSCISSNKKIDYCSVCEYSETKNANIEHAFSKITHNISNGTRVLYSVCSKCGSWYTTTMDGHIFKYSNGQVADPDNLILPNTIYNDRGQSYYVTAKTDRVVRDDSLFDLSYSLNGRTLSIKVIHTVPEDMLKIFSTSQLSNQNIAWFNIGETNLTSTAGYKNISPSTRSYDSSTGKITATFTCTLREPSKDYSVPGIFNPFINYNYEVNGVRTTYQYAGDGSRTITTNFTDPTITSVNH